MDGRLFPLLYADSRSVDSFHKLNPRSKQLTSFANLQPLFLKVLVGPSFFLSCDRLGSKKSPRVATRGARRLPKEH